MQIDGDGARIQEFSQSLWRILRWTHKTLRLPSATPTFELLVALGASADAQLSYDELEAMTKRSHRAMQYVVHDMRAMGLIEVRSGADDRRRRIIRLSAAGLRLYREYCDLVLSELGKFALETMPSQQDGSANGASQGAALGGAVSVAGAANNIKVDRERI